MSNARAPQSGFDPPTLKARRAKHVGAAPKEVLDTVRAYIALLIGAR
jgi:hypothetical protein